MIERTTNMMIERTTKFQDLPELLTPAEVRRYLGVGRTTVYDLIQKGELPSKRFGRLLFIPKHALSSPDEI